MKCQLLLLTLFMGNYAQAQLFQSHQWKNRIVVVVAENSDNQLFKDQLQVFEQTAEGMKDRKIVVYAIQQASYQQLNYDSKTSEMKGQKSTALYQQFKEKEKDFRVILIGLDGGQKFEKDEPISSEELFSQIDRMPMRRSELRRRND